jgi:hypothetical protein
MKLLSSHRLVASLLVALALAFDTSGVSSNYDQKTITELIDDLTQIDSESLGINSAAVYEGFIGNDKVPSFQEGLLGVPAPKVSLQMRELVRRGPAALPELIRHLDDRRPTSLQVGNSSDSSGATGHFFMFTLFSDEYDPRVPHWFDKETSKSWPKPVEKTFDGRYKVKVGDVCYVLIGQIVNRQLVAVWYQPTAGLIVNSPIEVPSLAEKVRNDWGKADAGVLEAALLADVRAANHPRRIGKAAYTARFVNPALERLRLYFPDTYNALKGDDLRKKKEFENQESDQPR